MTKRSIKAALLGALAALVTSHANAQLPPSDAASASKFESDFVAMWPDKIVCLSYKQDVPGDRFTLQAAVFRLTGAHTQISRSDFRTPVAGMIVYESRAAGADRSMVVNAATKRVISASGLPQPNNCYSGMSVDPTVRQREASGAH